MDRRLTRLALCISLAAALALPLAAADSAPAAALWRAAAPAIQLKLDPALVRQFLGETPTTPPLATFIVRLKTRADLAAHTKYALGKLEARKAALAALKATAQTAQAGLRALLDSKIKNKTVRGYQPFYIFNGLAVEGDLALALELAARPEVERLEPVSSWNAEANTIDPADRSDPANPADSAKPNPKTSGAPSAAPTENIALVGADRVWNELGVRGEGVVVASIDSGVDWQHAALFKQYRGAAGGKIDHNYNWFDADGVLYPGGGFGPSRSAAPSDPSGHGTRVTGVMVGDGGVPGTRIGMAPGAQWIAVTANRLTPAGALSDDVMMHKALQWLLAPTDLTGAAATADPARAPDVVCLAWAVNNGGDTTFRDDLAALRAAGIVPIVAAGDTFSPGYGTIGSPAALAEAFAAGATTRLDALLGTSGCGPTLWGATKPDAAAPGEAIYSSIPGGYAAAGGTAMAAAHVAGLAALLRSACPGLSVAETEQSIRNGALDLGNPGPDNRFGAGRIRAWEAVQSARSGGWIAGRVLDAITLAPIPGATIRTQDAAAYTAVADAAGNYRLSVPAGAYDLQAWGFGSNPRTFSGAAVLAGVQTHLDFSLVRSTRFAISGKVANALNQGLAAQVRVLDQPASATCAAGGNFTLQLPPGQWTLEATLRGYKRARRAVTVTAAAAGINITLETAPRVLYVEADRRLGYYKGYPAGEYFRRALEDRGYLYDVLEITTTTLPTANWIKANYDVLIWQHSNSAPARMTLYGYDAVGLLGDYLDLGGRLFISGLDIGYWDQAAAFYAQGLHARFVADQAVSPAAIGRGPLAGLRCDFEGIDAQKRSNSTPLNFMPDVVAPVDFTAFPILDYDGGEGAAAIAWHSAAAPDTRVVYFACGFEAVGPRPVASELLDRSLQWLFKPLPQAAFNVHGKTAFTAQPATVQTLDQTVSNNGFMGDSYILSLASGRWIWELWNQAGNVKITQVGAFGASGSGGFKVRARVPALAKPFDRETAVLRVASRQTPALVTTRTLSGLILPLWENAGVLPVPLYRFGAASVEPGSFCVIGGRTGAGAVTAAAWRFAGESWAPLPPKPNPAEYFQAAVIGHDIYCPGGYDGTKYLNTLDVFHADTGQWETRRPIPVPIGGAACAAAGGKLYLFGGRTAAGYVDTTWVYDPAADLWTARAPLPGGPRGYIAAAANGGLIYVAGGWYTNAFECYNPAADTWQRLPAVPQSASGRMAPGIAVAGGLIMVLGGGLQQDGLADCHAYDPATRLWIALDTLKTSNRAGCAAVAALGKVWVLGGETNSVATNQIEFLRVSGTLENSTKQVDKGLAVPGEYLTYTIRLVAGSPIAAVSAIDPIPAGTTYASGSASGGASYNSTLKQIEWRGDLLTTLTQQFSFRVKINALPGTSRIVNTCTFSDPVTQYRRSVLTRLNLPDLAGTCSKRVDRAEAEVGDDLDYTIEIVNTGMTPTTVTVTDPLPPGTAFVSSFIPALTYNIGAKRVEAKVWAPVSTLSTRYEFTDSRGGEVPFAWTDISLLGADAGIAFDDQISAPKPLGFNFKFFGKTFNTLRISDNGYLTFEDSAGSQFNEAIPRADEPNNFIAPFWDDLKTVAANGCRIWCLAGGTAPNRLFIVQYKTQGFFGSGSGFMEFQVILMESGDIKFQYLNMDTWNTGDGSSATIGVENEAGDAGAQYLYNGLPLANRVRNNLAVLLTAPRSNPVTLAYRVRVTTTSCATILNRATLDAGGGILATVTTETQVNRPRLEITKTVDKIGAKPGDVLTYRVTLVNRSARLAANGVTLRDQVSPLVTNNQTPAGMIYIPSSRTLVGIYDLLPGQSVTGVYTAVVGAAARDGALISAPATVEYGCPEPLRAQALTVVGRPDLSASSMVVDRDWARGGDILTYQIRILNTGPAATSATLIAYKSSVLDWVPGTLTATAGTVSLNTQWNRIEWSGTVPAAPAVVEINYRVKIAANVKNYTILSQATIDWNAPPPRQARVSASTSVIGVNDVPSIRLLRPLTYNTPTTQTYTIQWTDSDPDSAAQIALFADIDDSGADGIPLASGISEDDGYNRFTFDTITLPDGIWFIYAAIDDGVNDPVIAYAPGSLRIARGMTLDDILNHLLGKPALPPLRLPYADVNRDGAISVADVLAQARTIPPDVPSGPRPASGSAGVALTPLLRWNPAPGASTYDVYLWLATQPRPASRAATGLTGPQLGVTTALAPSTTYLWQVIAWKPGLKSEGPVWAFTTK